MSLEFSPAEIFRALGDEHRLKILDFIAHGDPTCCATGDGICGCDLQELTGLSQPTVSHHMKVLADAGLVHGEKRGRWVYYSLNRAAYDRAASALTALFSSHKLIQLEVTS